MRRLCERAQRWCASRLSAGSGTLAPTIEGDDVIIQLPEDSLYTLEEGLFSLDFDYPFTWIHGQGWRFVVGRTDPSGGYYLYRFGPVPGWIWTAPHLHGWHYDFSAQSWQTP